MRCGEKIAELRKKNGMTQDDLGKAMNVSYQAVSKWERGESQPDFETMSKIAKLFNVPITYFEENGEIKQEESKEEEPKQEDAKEEHGTTIGVCTVCGKLLKEGEEETTTPKLVCKACSERQTREAQAKTERARREAQERAERAKREAQYAREQEAREVIGHGFDKTLIVSLALTIVCYIVLAVLTFINLDSEDLVLYGSLLFLLPLFVFGITHSVAGSIQELRGSDDESGYKLVLSLIMGAVLAVIHAALFLALYLSAEDGEDFYFLILLILGAILTFTFVSQYLWGGVIGEVFTAGGFTFKLPGFLITLSIDSILWMIITKFFLGILAAIVFVLTAVLFAVVAIFASVFFFIPCLLFKLGRDHKAKNKLIA